MADDPTSAYTLEDLILEVARKLGIAEYDISGVIDIPSDAHDLDLCKRIVNNGIRMFIADGPRPHGWRWQRPVKTVTIWGTISGSSDNTIDSVSYDAGANLTTITVEKDSFYETMEEKTISIEGVGDFPIYEYVGSKSLILTGDASSALNSGDWNVTEDGNYTLPRDFGGQHEGTITYDADTNQGVSLEWVHESTIRLWRENITDETGDPYWVAIRIMSSVPSGRNNRRRWELVVYPSPDEVMQLRFPYMIYFDSLTSNSEVPPIPFFFDEALKAACLAMAEKDENDTADGPDFQYYRTVALPNAHSIDARSAPQRLGYFGNPNVHGTPDIHDFRSQWYQRPDVSFNP